MLLLNVTDIWKALYPLFELVVESMELIEESKSYSLIYRIFYLRD